jgi:L-seryl-tRNA(Ser) seleniumtransferase
MGVSGSNIMPQTKQETLAAIPGVDTVLEREDMRALCDVHPRELVVAAIREAFDDLRRRILADEAIAIDEDAIAAQVRDLVEEDLAPPMRRAINAAGIVLHTALGRSVLAPSVADAVREVAARNATLQIDLPTGRRGDRDVHVREMLQRLTGCEDATFVNNNAGATYLMLAALCEGKEIVISRGQLVEIGGAFRMPDVIARSGATMIEVGSTNKTHRRDYEGAITENTAALLHAHQSNFRMIGFTKIVPIAEMAEAAHSHGILCLDDQGNGMLHDLTPYGLPYEPTVQDSLRAGADIVCFSTDKLIGGPQGGVLAGKRDLIGRIRKHPMYRALRPDKLAYTALWHTLRLHLDRESVVREIPTLRHLTRPIDEIANDAFSLVEMIGNHEGGADIQIIDGESEVGGGSMAGTPLPTKLIAIRPVHTGETELANRLRTRPVPIVTRTGLEAVLLDPRCIEPDELNEVAIAIKEELDVQETR